MKSYLWLMLLFTGFWYNSYFGWNAFPKNDAEMICDMLFGIMAVMVITKSTDEATK